MLFVVRFAKLHRSSVYPLVDAGYTPNAQHVRNIPFSGCFRCCRYCLCVSLLSRSLPSLRHGFVPPRRYTLIRIIFSYFTTQNNPTFLHLFLAFCHPNKGYRVKGIEARASSTSSLVRRSHTIAAATRTNLVSPDKGDGFDIGCVTHEIHRLFAAVDDVKDACQDQDTRNKETNGGLGVSSA